ncbi:MAG: hypothetical protein AUG75_09535 [Cyanobacteria bacterium 13_1_20CM_4_61_6]|nr:MAG: hypothetical protein AUG75_09535 [Cyanobacteria bacterium 13_1_20CM_4_61_6]
MKCRCAKPAAPAAINVSAAIRDTLNRFFDLIIVFSLKSLERENRRVGRRFADWCQTINPTARYKHCAAHML